MAVSLLAASSAKVDFGDIADIVGLTQISVALTLKPTAATASLRRIFGQWASTSLAFLLFVNDTDELEWLVTDNTNFWGRKTTGLNLASGTTYRIVVQHQFPSTFTNIWVNGVLQSLAADGSNSVASMANSTRTVAAGYETGSSSAGADGEYSEIAIWSGLVSNEFAAAYGLGYSPLFHPAFKLHYWPLTTTSDMTDVWGSATGTNSSGTNATHPTMIAPVAPTVANLTQFGVRVDAAVSAIRVSQVFVEFLASEAVASGAVRLVGPMRIKTRLTGGVLA